MKIFHILALLLILLGFGIVHNTNSGLQMTGSIFISAGCLYFLVILLFSLKKDKANKD